MASAPKSDSVIRLIRKACGVTAFEMGELMGMPHWVSPKGLKVPYWNKVEMGYISLDLLNTYKLCQLTGCTLGQLVSAEPLSQSYSLTSATKLEVIAMRSVGL